MKPRTTEKAFPFEGGGVVPPPDEGGRTVLTFIPPVSGARNFVGTYPRGDCRLPDGSLCRGGLKRRAETNF